MRDDKSSSGHQNQIEVTIIVGGEDVQVRVNENAPLRTLLEKALDESGHQGQPIERWQLYRDGMQLVDLGVKIGTLGLLTGSTLSMSLAAGAGG